MREDNVRYINEKEEAMEQMEIDRRAFCLESALQAMRMSEEPRQDSLEEVQNILTEVADRFFNYLINGE